MLFAVVRGEAEMEKEEGMSEIDKAIALLKANGYSVTKRKPYERLIPCVCGHERRAFWWTPEGSFFQCHKCDFKGGKGKGEREARSKWNEAVREARKV